MASYGEVMPREHEPEQRYDPRFVTDFGIKPIELNGCEFVIHNTNSLPGIIESVIAYEIGEEPSTLQDSANRERVAEEPVAREAILGFLAEETEVVQAVRSILEVRAMEKKDATLRLVDVSAHMAHPTERETSDIEPIRDYYLSLAFDQIAARAWAIDPAFDLIKFVE